MSNADLVDALYDHVVGYGNGHLSFVEISTFLESKGMEVEGSDGLNFPDMNIVIWDGMSDDFVSFIVDDVQPDKRFMLDATDPLVYMHDGVCLTLPLARKLPKGGYKKTHWAPSVLRAREVKDEV